MRKSQRQWLTLISKQGLTGNNNNISRVVSVNPKYKVIHIKQFNLNGPVKVDTFVFLCDMCKEKKI